MDSVGEIAAANIIPVLLTPKPTGHGMGENEATVMKREIKSQKELLDKMV